MQGSRLLGAAVAVFAAGLVAAVVAINRYDEAYGWVAHTSDVRLVLGRAVGHATTPVSCAALRGDLAELERLTTDNPVQQRRLPSLRAGIEAACRAEDTTLVAELSELDATERSLMGERRVRLADVRRFTLAAFVLSTLGAIGAIGLSRVLQRRAVEALTTSEERFRMLASSSRDIIRVHDPSGRTTYVSPSVEVVLGYTPDEFLTLPPLSLGHADDLERMRQSLADVQARGTPGTTLVYRLRGADGGYRWFETHTNPIRDAGGKLLRFYTTARDISERVALEQKLEAEAVTDELTGLLNRRGFQLLAGQEHKVAMRQQHGLAVVFADLDGLKTINDKLGHDHGDRAIRALAEILRRTFREADVVARLGGDEFAVLAYNADEAAVDKILRRLRDGVAAAPPIGPYPLAVSLGVAILPAATNRSLDDLITEADQRMYEEKRARKASELAR